MPRKIESRISNPEIAKRFRDLFAEKLEDLVTGPSSKGKRFDLGIVENVRRGGKIPHRIEYDAKLIMAGQDLRLSPDEIDELREKFFEKRILNAAQFIREISERENLWIEVLNSSEIDPEKRGGCEKAIREWAGKLKEEDGFYVFSANNTRNLIETLHAVLAGGTEEEKSVFENIRDDLYALLKEAGT